MDISHYEEYGVENGLIIDITADQFGEVPVYVDYIGEFHRRFDFQAAHDFEGLCEMTDIKELTPTIVNSLIERIEVHNNDKSSGHCYVKVDIYFTAMGMFKVPTEDEIVAIMEEIRKNPQTTALQHKKKRCNPFSELHRNLHRNYFLMGLAHC